MSKEIEQNVNPSILIDVNTPQHTVYHIIDVKTTKMLCLKLKTCLV